jgi:hypothetical protein
MESRQIPKFTSKIGRNQLCPCGSGKKYKRCHGGADSGGEPIPGMIDARLRKLKPQRKCLVPDSLSGECSRGTINAHTVSRSASLGAIAHNGHVYSYKISIQELIKSKGRILPTRTGWKDASTFPGFCGVHDKKLFSPLEDFPFIATKEQCFLLSYRAVAREYYAKQGSMLQSDLRHALSSKNRAARQLVGDFNKGVELGMRDAEHHKKRYDAILLERKWQQVRAVVIEFDGLFPIQCAASFQLEHDVYGNEIQFFGFGQSTPDSISLTSFVAGGISYICFCWLADSDSSCKPYVEALRRAPLARMPAILAEVLLQTSENCHFSPTWYDGMPEAGKEWCAAQMRNGVTLDLGGGLPPPALSAAGVYLPGSAIKTITELA